MSVHKAITEHSKSQNKRVNDFLLLDQQREEQIEAAIEKCSNKLPFDVSKINAITKEINELAKKGIVPQRKLVTKEMIEDFVRGKS